MPAWYCARGVLDILCGSGILWRSSFSSVSPGDLYSSDYSTIMGTLGMCDSRHPHVLVDI